MMFSSLPAVDEPLKSLKSIEAAGGRHTWPHTQLKMGGCDHGNNNVFIAEGWKAAAGHFSHNDDIRVGCAALLMGTYTASSQTPRNY